MAIKHARFQARGKILGTALNSATYQTVFSADDDILLLMIFNTCNQPILVSLTGGPTAGVAASAVDHFELDGESFILDMRTSSRHIKKPIIMAKRVSATPTQGSLRISVVY